MHSRNDWHATTYNKIKKLSICNKKTMYTAKELQRGKVKAED